MSLSKLIKLSEQHYIIVDDSEIEEGDYHFKVTNGKISNYVLGSLNPNKGIYKKITHSTDINVNEVYYIPLSEVQELINGYSVEEIAENSLKQQSWDTSLGLPFNEGYIKGYIIAHQDLTKDKLFTIEDIEKAMIEGLTIEKFWERCCQSLQPKTEWDVEFDEQGKMKLI